MSLLLESLGSNVKMRLVLYFLETMVAVVKNKNP